MKVEIKQNVREFLLTPAFWFVVAWLLLLPLLWLDDLPQRDVLGRYIPMAHAFAMDDWNLAFDPRVSPLFPVVSGMVCRWFHCTGFAAVKFTSALAFSLAVFPLFALLRRVFDRGVAVLGCGALVFCSYLLRLATSGMRETTKCLMLILTTWALVALWQNRSRLRWYLMLGVTAGLLIMTRDDSVLLVGAIFFFTAICDAGQRRFPWRSVVMLAVFSCVMLPLLLLNYNKTGYFVPGLRYAWQLEAFGVPAYCFGGAPRGEVPAAGSDEAGEKALHVRPDSLDEDDWREAESSQDLGDFFDSFFKGIYWPFVLLALPAIVFRIRRRVWTGSESIVAGVLVFHTLAIIVLIAVFDGKLYVARRYLLPAAPLISGWLALTLRDTFMALRRVVPVVAYRRLAVGSFLVAAVLLYVDAAIPALEPRVRSGHVAERRLILDWAELIKNEMSPCYQPGIGMHPCVAVADLYAIGALAGGRSLMDFESLPLEKKLKMDYFVEKLMPPENCRDNGLERIAEATLEGCRYVLWRRIPSAVLRGDFSGD